MTIPIRGSAEVEYPNFDARVPTYIQQPLEYMAPEYALDELLLTASDMYSLGCVIYAVHCKGKRPFETRGLIHHLRENAGKPLSGIETLDKDLQSLLHSLITRHANSRPTPMTLPSHPFFSSLSVSTLNFLERSNFTSKTREEKITFMKGLTTVLDKFSEVLRIRKILPTLVEEMKDVHLLPYILPNVFVISTSLSPTQFSSTVLPSLKPLFSIKEPPQNMLTLLDNLAMLQNKTERKVFKEHVLPLVYNALDSEHAVVQERALKAITELCESMDYAEVQEVLFPRVAYVFAKTRILTVKVATLVTFLAMVKTLDQASLTQRLVPLLSKIRTKEPAVMMATLSVQEAMGFKVDREAVATLVLPQLWIMSIGPLLNVEQFQRFMSVIRRLSERVEKEHDQYLRDSQRIEDRSAVGIAGITDTKFHAGQMEFESLIGSNSAKITREATWGDEPDDIWGSIFKDDSLPSIQPLSSQPTSESKSGQLPVLSTHSSANASFPKFPSQPPAPNTLQMRFSETNNYPFVSNSVPQQPNYHVSLSPLPTNGEPLNAPVEPKQFPLPKILNSDVNVLIPSKPNVPPLASSKVPPKIDWGDFDPLA